MQEYLVETAFLDFSSANIREVVGEHTAPASSERENAVALFYYTRDQFRYDPYHVVLDPIGLKASSILDSGRGYCISKAVLYAALLRAVGIPSRLAFADVKNHLTSPRLRARLQSDIFSYHGYAEVFLNGKWLKATNAFNKELCEKAGIHALDFDGESDALFHPFSKDGSKHMEYIKDRGSYSDLPLEHITAELKRIYPESAMKPESEGDFLQEVSTLD